MNLGDPSPPPQHPVLGNAPFSLTWGEARLRPLPQMPVPFASQVLVSTTIFKTSVSLTPALIFMTLPWFCFPCSILFLTSQVAHWTGLSTWKRGPGRGSPTDEVVQGEANDGCPHERRRMWTDTQVGRHATVEVDVGVMRPPPRCRSSVGAAEGTTLTQPCPWAS